MNTIKVHIAHDVAVWLRDRRLNVRMSLTEASLRSQISPDFIVQWESGMPISVPEFIILMNVYQVPGVVVNSYLRRLQVKYLGDDF